jgi:hypothetical protein
VKISVLHIIAEHFRTLKDTETGRIPPSDLIIFVAIPIIFAIGSTFCNIKIGKDFYNLSITFFGIFIALLLNIQVAMFSVFQRNWSKQDDHILSQVQSNKLEQRRRLLSDLNVNVSYLIVLSCLCLIVYIFLFSTEAENLAARVVSCFLYTHFTLTLLMIVKRTHALFQGEYNIL